MEDLTSVIKESFIQYSGAVLQSRALVDARDCLKPSARQIFDCLYTDKFLHSKPMKKTLKAKADLDKAVKGWAEKGIVVEFKDAANKLEATYTIVKLA